MLLCLKYIDSKHMLYLKHVYIVLPILFPSKSSISDSPNNVRYIVYSFIVFIMTNLCMVDLYCILIPLSSLRLRFLVDQLSFCVLENAVFFSAWLPRGEKTTYKKQEHRLYILTYAP